MSGRSIEIKINLSSQELSEAIVHYEAVHGAISEACPELVVQLINYTIQTINAPDFYYVESDEVPDRVAKVLQNIADCDTPRYLEKVLEDYELQHGRMLPTGVSWQLIEAIVRATIEADNATIGLLGTAKM